MDSSILMKQQAVLDRISSLPEKLLQLHTTENICEFLLYDLCDAECFDLKRAAYFVDNPDFDCLKGVAGFDAQERFVQAPIWETPELFVQHMQQAQFNQKVRSISRHSMQKLKQSDQEIIGVMAPLLGLQNPFYCSWQMKHDNHGLLIYEAELSCPIPQEIIRKGACLLGFCPIY